MVEIVSARVRSIGVVEKSRAKHSRISISKSSAIPSEFVETYFESKKSRVAVYHREKLRPGARLRMPCIVTEYSATTLVPESRALVDARNVMIQY